MQDPHVVALRYRLEPTESLTFENPPAIEDETDAFRLHLENGVATFEMKEHFPSVDSSRNVVEPFLQAWELDTALRNGRREIRFKLEDAEVIDRNPPPPGSIRIFAETATATLKMGGSASAHVTRRHYPEPPKHFRVSPDVEILWWHYENYLNNREPLLPMAYLCLTLLEFRAGNRQKAASMYQISRNVLDTLSNLASRGGDERTARKFNSDSTLTPLTSAETAWIEAAIKAIIRRVGEIASNPSLPAMTMSDLPKL